MEGEGTWEGLAYEASRLENPTMLGGSFQGSSTYKKVGGGAKPEA